MKKHLITGGAGFIGYHLAHALADRGDQVHVVDNLARGRLDPDMQRLVDRPNVSFQNADLLDPATFADWDDDYDGVYHLAAIVGVRNVMNHPERVLSVNARAVLSVVEWFCASRSQRLFFSSTSEAYAWTMTFHPLPIPTPEDVPLAVDDVANPRATYALSKVFGEMVVAQSCARAGKAWAMGRYHNVYGPRMGMDHVIPELFARIHAGQSPLEVFSPDERRAFCYIDDAITATLLLMRDETPSGVYNVGNSAEEVRIADLAHVMLDVAGAADREIAARSRQAAGIPRRCPDVTRLMTATGYRPEVTLREGLRRTLAWYEPTFEGGRAAPVAQLSK